MGGYGMGYGKMGGYGMGYGKLGGYGMGYGMGYGQSYGGKSFQYWGDDAGTLFHFNVVIFWVV